MTYIEKRLDSSESIDPQQAIDELLIVARWIENYVGEDKQRIPKDVRDLLDATDEERLLGFTRFQPTRNMVDDEKLKMQQDLFKKD